MEAAKTILRMSHIRKEFPGVVALDDVGIEVHAGEVLALLGENGAGKSTLIKIIAGIYKEDQGEIFFEDRKVDIRGITDSTRLGISVVHQELSLCANMTVAQNIFLGKEQTKSRLFCNDKAMVEKAGEILRQLNIDISPTAKVSDLSIAQQQMVEIARAMNGDIKLLVLDEPTGTLTDKEVSKLFELIHLLKTRGVGMIYISHRLEELFQIADRVTVMRDGHYIDTISIKDATYNRLVNLLVGREMNEMYPVLDNTVGETLLKVEHLTRGKRVRDVSFDLKAGEILGFYGLIGSGRTEIMRMLYGIDRPDAGTVTLEGTPVQIDHVDKALDLGISMVPENRKEQGLILIQTVEYNITLSILKKLFRGGKMDETQEQSIVDSYIRGLSIKTPSQKQKVKFLSGGNQQKVVLAKNLATNPRVLILDEPTRGIDVGAKKEIYSIIMELAKQGVSIIMVSSEMPEIIHLSNRVAVMYEGRLMGILDRNQISEQSIISLAMGKEGANA